MISWKSQMSPKEIQQVSSFIYTLEGTNPANPKEPQGELFEREEATTIEAQAGM
jgi:cytochrome c oxidase cbb3-type subunit 3